MDEPRLSTILVVNDDEIGRYAMGRILRQAGFGVLEAATGNEGLELAASLPDLVLLDVNLPDISGLEVSARLKGDPATAHIPVLHISATFIDADSQVRGLESGADGYLTYPLEPPVLIATVRAHLRLREAEAQRQELALLLEDVGDAIIVTTPDLKVQRWNRGAERVYGWTEGEVAGRDLAELVCIDSSGDELEPVLRALGDSGHWEGEVRHRNRSGEELFILSSLTLASASPGSDKMMVIVNRDVSELRRAEIERERLVEELRQLNAELEQRVAQRTRELSRTNRVLTSRSNELEALAYSISHDVRAPLRGIDGFSMVLKEDYGELLDEQGRNYLDRIRRAARLMGEQIDHLLALSRLSRWRTSASRVDLTALSHELLSSLAADHPEVDLEFSVEEGLSVVGDEDLLRTLMGHLLENAFKFSQPLERVIIEVGSTEEGDEQVFFVRDHGVGFDMKYRDKLFTAFQHLHPTSEFPGAGVGLATVRRVVHRHGGRVWAESSPGNGATFWFTLPHAPDTEELRQSDQDELASRA
ncbi:MAG TPA: ATP-binding protein [Trueperaceae bacterium]